jgi:hypothetical protein
MISLQRLIQLQFFYYAMGMVFNFVSMYALGQGEQQLTPNDPYSGCLSMTIYAFFLIPGLKQKVVSYRILMLVAVILIGYGGVVRHIDLYQSAPELYTSTAAAIIGPGINIFGLILNLIAVAGLFRKD